MLFRFHMQPLKHTVSLKYLSVLNIWSLHAVRCNRAKISWNCFLEPVKIITFYYLECDVMFSNAPSVFLMDSKPCRKTQHVIGVEVNINHPITMTSSVSSLRWTWMHAGLCLLLIEETALDYHLVPVMPLSHRRGRFQEWWESRSCCSWEPVPYLFRNRLNRMPFRLIIGFTDCFSDG